MAVSVLVTQCQRASAPLRGGCNFFGFVISRLVRQHTGAGAGTFFVICCSCENFCIGRKSCQNKDGRLVGRQSGLKNCIGERNELSFATVSISSKASALSGCNYQIIPTISIQISPRNSWTKLTQLFRQQGLPLKIIKRLFMVLVANH